MMTLLHDPGLIERFFFFTDIRRVRELETDPETQLNLNDMRHSSFIDILSLSYGLWIAVENPPTTPKIPSLTN